jgi:uncharacterized membrane protein
MNRARSYERRGRHGIHRRHHRGRGRHPEVYDVWTAFEDFPEFMDVVERVDLVSEDSLHWVAVVDDDIVEWDADVVEHVPDESVSWQAIDGREAGKVTFEKLGAGRTKVHYQLDYDPKA